MKLILLKELLSTLFCFYLKHHWQLHNQNSTSGYYAFPYRVCIPTYLNVSSTMTCWWRMTCKRLLSSSLHPNKFPSFYHLVLYVASVIGRMSSYKCHGILWSSFRYIPQCFQNVVLSNDENILYGYVTIQIQLPNISLAMLSGT